MKLLATCPGHALHREQILDALWPGVDAESTLNSFGKALHAARRAIEPELLPRQSSAYLRLTDSMVMLNTEHTVIDADRFEYLAEDALRRRDISAYRKALAAYGGELLPEDRYADWCTVRRGFLTELHVRLLLGLADATEKSGAYDESADCLREVLKLEPTREEVHRRLMRLFAELGTPDQSVRQFHLCEQVLRRELALAPQHETVSLYHDVLASQIPDRTRLPQGDREPPAPRQPQLAELSLRGPFVGRERALAHLSEQLSRGAHGPGMILLSGEAGVGKTRLLEEFATTAGRLGAAVLWGGTGAHASYFAAGPFAVALEGYAASRPQAERNELADLYPALARFVPSIAASSRHRAPAPDPHAVILAIARLLTEVARSRRVLLVLGDLHELDPSSLDVLRYLAHLAVRRPWLLIGTVRDEEVETGTELRRMIDATMRARLCERVAVQSLSRSDCDQLVRASLPGRQAGTELLQQIYTRSRGNPLFIEELVRELHQASELMFTDGHGLESAWVPSRVPARVRHLATARLAQVDETMRRVLGLAAAASATEISLSELRTGAATLEPPISDASLFEALDEALRKRILEEGNSGYAFRHPLFRSAVYHDLPRHRRDQLRAALSGRLRSAPEHTEPTPLRAEGLCA
jgi:DNA-binding SARP family transcriptional activator